jgi:DNA-binding NarL/FixJ family response regulator
VTNQAESDENNLIGRIGDILADIAELKARLDRLEAQHKLNGQITLHPLLPKFSARQKAILEHICRGESNKHIGRHLELPESTIKVHVRELMHKLSASNRTQVAIIAARMRLV